MNRRVLTAILILLLFGMVALLLWQPWKTDWNEYNRWGKKQPFDFAFFQKLMETRQETEFSILDGPQEKHRDKLKSASVLIYNYFGSAKLPFIKEMLDSGKTVILIGSSPYMNNLSQIDSVRYHKKFEQYYETKKVKPQDEEIDGESLFDEFANNNALYLKTYTSEEKVKLKAKGGEAFSISLPSAAQPYLLSGFRKIRMTEIALGQTDAFYVEDLIGGITLPARNGEIVYIIFPSIFSNFYLENPDVFNLVQQITQTWPTGKIIVDETVPPKNPFSPSGNSYNSPLGFIMANMPLRIGWFLLLGGVLLFIVFQSKRIVRAIPIIPVKENKTLEFAKTLGTMELRSRNHSKMARNILDEVEGVVRKRFHRRDFDLSHAHWNQLKAKNPKLPTEFDLLPLMKARLERNSEFTQEELVKLYNSRTAFLNYLDHGRKNGK